MQTFLPYPSFTKSAKVLDWRRLNKQRSEARTILDQLMHGGRWRNHPAVLMWDGYLDALSYYGDCMIREWKRRGYVNNMFISRATISVQMPRWLGVDVFHASHRSNLLRKLPEHYEQFGWKEGPDLPYFWPTKEGYQ